MTTIARETVDALDFPELIDALQDLQGRRTPVGWTPDDAIRRSSVERRIMILLGQSPPDVERRESLRVPCELDVKLRAEEGSRRGKAIDLGPGGVYVQTKADLAVGTVVEVEVRGKGNDERGLRVKGIVAWRGKKGLGIMFPPSSSGQKRRLRRFTLELLQDRLAD